MLASGLRGSGFTALRRRLPGWRGVIVLSYHRIGEASACATARSLWTADLESFDRQLRALTRSCEVLDPAAFRPELLGQRGRRVLVTFDDCYRDLYESAHPALQVNGIRAAMFICSGFIDGSASAWWDEVAWIVRRSRLAVLPPGTWSSQGLSLEEHRIEQTIDLITRRCWTLTPEAISRLLDELARASGAGRRPSSDGRADWITWEMARELDEAGHRIGAHTMTHPILAHLPQERQRDEIAGSADRVESVLGKRPQWFAYPVGVPGAFDQASRSAAAEAGVELAFSNYGGRVTQANFHAMDVRRVSAETLRTPALFEATLAVPSVFVR